MIDSTNIRIIADNIRHLFKKVDSIEPGTVVEGNPSGSGFNTLLTKIKIGSSKYKLPNQVVANPETESTTLLESLQVGSDEFVLPANVTANPEGTATSDLTKIGIGSGIFGIPVGGTEYSTTEKKIGKWTDGSDLYMITYETNSPPADWNPVNNSGIDIKGFISEASYVDTTSSAGYHRFSLNSSHGGTSVTFIVNDTQTTHGDAHVIISSNGTRYRAALTIIYTK